MKSPTPTRAPRHDDINVATTTTGDSSAEPGRVDVIGPVGQLVVGTVVQLQCSGRTDCAACRMRRHISPQARRRQLGQARRWRSDSKR